MGNRNDNHACLSSFGRRREDDGTGAIFRSFFASCARFPLPKIGIADNEAGFGRW